GLGIFPIEDRQTAADVGLEEIGVTERQEANRGAERDHAQPKALLNFAGVSVDEIQIDAGRGALVIPDTQTAIEEVTQADRVFAADRASREITNMEKQRIFETAQIVDEDIVLVARVEASRHECPERKIQRLLGETRRRRKQSDAENKKTKSQAQS